MPYLYLLKYGKYVILALTLSYTVISIYNLGYNNANEKWKSIMERQEKINQHVQDNYNKKLKQKEQDALNLAHELDTRANDYEKQLDTLERSLSSANHARTRGVCKSKASNADHRNGLPANSNSTSVTKGADEAELTPEFREFLISNFRRGDEAGSYAEIAYDFIKSHTVNGKFVCNVTQK